VKYLVKKLNQRCGKSLGGECYSEAK